jgi:hypothetical protein
MLFYPASWGNPQKSLIPPGQSFQQPLKVMDFGSFILLYLPHSYLCCTVFTMHSASTKFLNGFFSKNTTCAIQQPLLELITYMTEPVSCKSYVSVIKQF